MSELPLAWASWAAAALMLLLLAFVWWMPRHPEARSWRGDLRIWATLLIGMQLGIYSIFA